jgi:hypothetical protein
MIENRAAPRLEPLFKEAGFFLSWTADAGSTGDSINLNRAETSTSQVAVQTTTLQALYDKYFKREYVDLCKIDIEGEEFDIFAAASDDLLRRIRFLVTEMHYFRDEGAARAEALVERLKGLGFVDITIEEADRTGDVAAEVKAFRRPGADAVSVPSLSAA